VGSWDELTISQAYFLNDPIILWQPERSVHRQALARRPLSPDSDPLSFVTVDRPNVVIETVKQAQDGQGLILRLYESRRQRGAFTLTTSSPLAGAWRTNLLEENLEPLETTANSLRHFIKPYQIVTLRLLPQEAAP
jgi:alpha-mannosidase